MIRASDCRVSSRCLLQGTFAAVNSRNRVGGAQVWVHVVPLTAQTYGTSVEIVRFGFFEKVYKLHVQLSLVAEMNVRMMKNIRP